MSRPTKAAGFTHMGVHRDWVIQQIRRYGADVVCDQWDGTDEEAIAAIEADTDREYYDGCDNTDSSGRCQGHTP